MISFEEFVNSKKFVTGNDWFLPADGNNIKTIEYMNGVFIIDKSEDPNGFYELILNNFIYTNKDLTILEKTLYDFCVDEIW